MAKTILERVTDPLYGIHHLAGAIRGMVVEDTGLATGALARMLDEAEDTLMLIHEALKNGDEDYFA